jgi:hypothetical protein
MHIANLVLFMATDFFRIKMSGRALYFFMVLFFLLLAADFQDLFGIAKTVTAISEKSKLYKTSWIAGKVVTLIAHIYFFILFTTEVIARRAAGVKK